MSKTSSIFAALLSPQGKYLFDFFVIKNDEGYLLDCDGKLIKNLIENLSKYKIRSKVEIKIYLLTYVVGIINFENFKIIQKEQNKQETTFNLEIAQFLLILEIVI